MTNAQKTKTKPSLIWVRTKSSDNHLYYNIRHLANLACLSFYHLNFLNVYFSIQNLIFHYQFALSSILLSHAIVPALQRALRRKRVTDEDTRGRTSTHSLFLQKIFWFLPSAGARTRCVFLKANYTFFHQSCSHIAN